MKKFKVQIFKLNQCRYADSIPVIAEVPLGDGIPGRGAISAGEFGDAGDPILRVVALEIKLQVESISQAPSPLGEGRGEVTRDSLSAVSFCIVRSPE